MAPLDDNLDGMADIDDIVAQPSPQSQSGNEDQQSSQPTRRRRPSNTTPAKVSLQQHFRMYLNRLPPTTRQVSAELQDGSTMRYTVIIQQSNQCIRSLLEVPQSVGNSMTSFDLDTLPDRFPTPPFYRSLELYRPITTREPLGVGSSLVDVVQWKDNSPRETRGPVYIVVGMFLRGHENPKEKVVFVQNPRYVFWQVFWAVLYLRGISRTFLSLKHIKEFRLYKCCPKFGAHERIELDSHGVEDLQLFLDAYKQWNIRPGSMEYKWADWISDTLNNFSRDVPTGPYSLEIVLDWSPTRITIVIFLPVLLSLAVGIWLNAANWTDLATIQTAWGTASYIVTAGGVTAALLAILSSI